MDHHHSNTPTMPTWHQRALPHSIPTTTNTTMAAAAAADTAAAVATMGIATTTMTAATTANNNNAKSSSPPKKKPPASKRTWDENYQALLLYKQEHGHLVLPHKNQESNRILATWVAHQRENYNSGQLSQDRIDALEAIGFIWNPHEKRWNDTYQRLVAYWKENGHSKVPTAYKPDPALGKWVSRQREDYSCGYMPANRKKKLDALGFVYRISKNGKGRQKRNRPDDDRWDQRYAELVEFKNKHGHANVPRPNKKTDKLSGWVGVQRCNYGRGIMPQERIDKLREVGFIFNFDQKKKQEEWNRMYELLKCCSRKADGSFQVSNVGDDASSLSRWIQRQKEKYKLHKLEPGREILLKKLDFRFPERGPKPERLDSEDKEQSESLKRTFAEIDNTDMFGGAVAGGTRVAQAHMKGDTSMVAAIIDLAGDDKDLGKKVSESINILSAFMSVSPEELATRMSAPMSHRTTTQANNKPMPARNKDCNAFGTLLPLVIKLQQTASQPVMQDCVAFLLRMVRRSKANGARVQLSDDTDLYNQLLSLSVSLSQELDNTHRSRAIVESCAMYFRHRIENGIALADNISKTSENLNKAITAQAKTITAQAKTIAAHPTSAAKRPRTSRFQDWDNELAG